MRRDFVCTGILRAPGFSAQGSNLRMAKLKVHKTMTKVYKRRLTGLTGLNLQKHDQDQIGKAGLAS